MQSIDANGYQIHFNDSAYISLNTLLRENAYSALFFIADSNTSDMCLPQLLAQTETECRIEVIEVDAGESSKNIETCVQIWQSLTELGADRKSLIINVGGGMITDLGGFVASTFKRGIDFIHIPTSLLAMVDASIGGKNGVDLGNLKNQVGVINPPKMVLIDTEFLTTLPQSEMKSGLAEMLKHGLIYDERYWKEFSEIGTIDFSQFDQLIHRSVEIKNEIVTRDPKEQNLRKALNFGHTLGHAIESYYMDNPTRKPLLHGEAVAIGMVLEAYLSHKLKLISESQYVEIKNLLKSIYGTEEIATSDIDPILELLIHDKKNEYGRIQFVLLNAIGSVAINQNADNEMIKEAFTDYRS
ncbi:MAG: 3-dehydroquinate synthase [Flavobacterium sp.]|nr:3-dehydroquinate synthase [Flavobacterium sp.]